MAVKYSVAKQSYKTVSDKDGKVRLSFNGQPVESLELEVVYRGLTRAQAKRLASKDQSLVFFKE